MNKAFLFSVLLALSAMLSGCSKSEENSSPASEQASLIPVTIENYNHAEAARNFNNWVKLGGDNILLHLKELSPVGPNAPTIRMNRDTLYSVGVFKNTGEITITLPESEQFQSVMVIDDQSFNPPVVNGVGTYPIKSDSDEHIDALYDGNSFNISVPICSCPLEPRLPLTILNQMIHHRRVCQSTGIPQTVQLILGNLAQYTTHDFA